MSSAIAGLPGAPPPIPTPQQMAELTRNVLNLTNADFTIREAALLDLSRKREEYPDLAPMLWHTFGTLTALCAWRRGRGRGGGEVPRRVALDFAPTFLSSSRSPHLARSLARSFCPPRSARDYRHLPRALAGDADRAGLEPRLQRPRLAAVRKR